MFSITLPNIRAAVVPRDTRFLPSVRRDNGSKPDNFMKKETKSKIYTITTYLL